MTSRRVHCLTRMPHCFSDSPPAMTVMAWRLRSRSYPRSRRFLWPRRWESLRPVKRKLQHRSPCHPLQHRSPCHPYNQHRSPCHPLQHRSPCHPLQHRFPCHPLQHRSPCHPFQNGANHCESSCAFRPSTEGAGCNTRLQSRIKLIITHTNNKKTMLFMMTCQGKDAVPWSEGLQLPTASTLDSILAPYVMYCMV